jgi:hypothetical protein
MRGDFTRRTFDQALQQVAGQDHYTAVLQQQGRVPLDADWNEQQALSHYRIEAEAQDVIGLCGAPAGEPGFAINASGNSLSISKGRFYVDGILCENPGDVDILQQPYWPLPTGTTLAALLGANDGSANALVYLDVWRRHITALEDPRIREVALGGPDTTTRVQTVWQVKALPISANSLGQGGLTCDGSYQEWEDLLKGSTGSLNARTQPVPNAEPCDLPPSAGYQRLENQLYRVEVHQGNADKPGVPTFTWSRDNGTVVTAITGGGGSAITVHDTGPDEYLGFASSPWAEISNDITELNGASGQLVKIQIAPDTTTIALTPPLDGSVDPTDAAHHPRLRRWDQDPTATSADTPVTGQWQDLEGGVQVLFATDNNQIYHTGDYWLIPARTATGNIDWPLDSTGQPTPQAPLGIQHHYCRLAAVTVDNTGLHTQNCRTVFPPLTNLPQSLVPPAMHVTGVKLQVSPTPPLPFVPIDFNPNVLNTVVNQLNNAQRANLATLHPMLQAKFVQAAAALPSDEARMNLAQSVLTPAPGAAAPAAARFPVNKVTPVLAAALAAAPTPIPAELLPIADIIDRAVGVTPPADVPNDSQVALDAFAYGIAVLCDHPVDPASLARPTCFITLEVPYSVDYFVYANLSTQTQAALAAPPTDAALNQANQIVLQLPGYHDYTLGASLSVTPNGAISWTPTPLQIEVIAEYLRIMANVAQSGFFLFRAPPAPQQLLARLTLKGRDIWASDDPTLHLDGATYGFADTTDPKNQRIGQNLVSGDGRRGSDFKWWFWLTPPTFSLSVSPAPPASVVAGNPARGIIVLSYPATAYPPLGDAIIQLQSSDPATAAVDSQFLMSAGQGRNSFVITTSPSPAVKNAPAGVPVTISATYLGVTQTAQLTVSAAPQGN